MTTLVITCNTGGAATTAGDSAQRHQRLPVVCSNSVTDGQIAGATNPCSALHHSCSHQHGCPATTTWDRCSTRFAALEAEYTGLRLSKQRAGNEQEETTGLRNRYLDKFLPPRRGTLQQQQPPQQQFAQQPGQQQAAAGSAPPELQFAHEPITDLDIPSEERWGRHHMAIHFAGVCHYKISRRCLLPHASHLFHVYTSSDDFRILEALLEWA